jgi:tRNA (adenine57-N1/adenine58-N1)-methyltransferase
MAGPFEPGERALLVDEKGRTFLVTLRVGASFHHHGGVVAHDDIIGFPEGSVAISRNGRSLTCFRPRLADFALKMPRGAQVIYPKDVAVMLMHCDIYPGARVLEAGTGSGSLCMALCRATGPEGAVVSYEMREEFQAKARANIETFFGELPSWLELRSGALQEVASSGERFDRVVLDMPEPWQTLDSLDAVLDPGGVVAGYVPTTGQMQTFVLDLETHGYQQILSVEALVRSWHVTRRSVRPDHRMVAHTGFIITGRKTSVRPPEGSDEG